MSFPIGLRFTTISAFGHTMALGLVFITYCVQGYRKMMGATKTRQQVAWTVRTSSALRLQGGVVSDSGKLINGRKRRILVDTLGLLMTVVVTAASVQYREGARLR